MVTVVDAYNFWDEFSQAETLAERKLGLGEEDQRMVVDLLVDQIEFADVIILNKCDLADEESLQKIEGAVRKLNPRAKVIRSEKSRVPLSEVLDTKRFDFEEAAKSPGWMKVMRGEETSEVDEYGFSSFVYRARRPFHPLRFWQVIQREWPGVVRSKGFFWLASRMKFVGVWSQAGGACEYRAGGVWWAAVPRDEWPAEDENNRDIEKNWQEPYGDRRQEIVIIGNELDWCLLTDAELAKGPEDWTKFKDPFSEWKLASATEEGEQHLNEREHAHAH
jgi:G3E family GTPase